MVAASAFIATVNQDVFRQLPRIPRKLGPKIRAYDSKLSGWLRSLTLLIGWVLFFVIGVSALICITRIDQIMHFCECIGIGHYANIGRIEKWDFHECESWMLSIQVIYYSFLALILALTCLLRSFGPDNE
jgi:hypothetical protein